MEASDEGPAPAAGQITLLLRRLKSSRDSSSSILEELYALVYGELERLAQGLLRGDRAHQSLPPAALVNEAYLRLIRQNGHAAENRAHFFGIAARAMRQVLVDLARERTALKRGGGQTLVLLDESVTAGTSDEHEVLEIHEALQAFARVDPRAAEVTELRLFGGLSQDEIAALLDVSRRTVCDDLHVSRLWLGRELMRHGS